MLALELGYLGIRVNDILAANARCSDTCGRTDAELRRRGFDMI